MPRSLPPSFRETSNDQVCALEEPASVTRAATPLYAERATLKRSPLLALQARLQDQAPGLPPRPAGGQQLDQLGPYRAAAQLAGFGIAFALQLLADAQHAFARSAPGQREGALQAGGAVIHLR